MTNTRESILLAALHLFAREGYEAVSVSDIAGELGMAKSALYRHYRSKRDIFDSIVAEMERLDRQWARQFDLPEGELDGMEQQYDRATLERIAAFARAQFIRWTRDDFSSSFRRMLTLEQYRSDEMSSLYQQYLGSGPLGYVADLFESLGLQDAERRAVELYAPMFLYYAVVDGADDRDGAISAFERHFEGLCGEWGVKA